MPIITVSSYFPTESKQIINFNTWHFFIILCAIFFRLTVSPSMKLRPNCDSDRAWIWSVAADFADETPKPELLAVRFANAESKHFYDLNAPFIPPSFPLLPRSNNYTYEVNFITEDNAKFHPFRCQ